MTWFHLYTKNHQPMKLFNKIFTSNSTTTSFYLRYDTTLDHWEVINNSGILYIGTKENCERLIRSTQEKMQQRKSK